MKTRFINSESLAIGGLLALIVSTIAHSYLLFHVSVEMFSILIAFSIFVFGWNTRRNFNNAYLLILSVAYLFIGFLDMMHTLSYQKMGIFDYEPNFAIEVWIAARMVEALTFVAAFFFTHRAVSDLKVLWFYILTTAGLMALIYSGYFPDCFVPGQGLTAFKIGMELAIVGVLAFSLYLLKNADGMPNKLKRLVAYSILATMAAELSFTLYHDMFGIFNIIGHILKVISFYLLYKAILSVGLTEPMAILTAKLHASEEANRHKQELLLQQSRLVGAGEVLSNIAHHWRQPLNALALIVQDIDDAYRNGEMNEAYLRGTIDRSMGLIQKMSEMINNFRNQYRATDTKERCDLHALLDQSVALLKPSLESMSIHIEITGGTCMVEVYQAELMQSFLNIINNAVEALRDQGNKTPRIVISITCKERGGAVIDFADNAGGIRPDILDQVFDPYVTTKHKAFGVGLGLYMTKLLIEEHMNGAISARNEGEGAVFTVTLPTA